MDTRPLVAFYGVWEDLHEYVRSRLPDVRLSIHTGTIHETPPDQATDIAAVFVNSKMSAHTLEQLPNLKLIATMSTGLDHIDLAETHKRKIAVSSVPTYGENTVAEHTFALILALTRRLYPSIKDVKEGRYEFGGLRGMDLKGKTLGVVGTGHIGAHVIRIAKGFEMRVVAHDPFPNDSLARQYDFAYTTLDTLLHEADIVTLHSPLLPSTHHLIHVKNITLMKKGSFLINTARGALIEPAAALAGLESGRLAGLGLDVLEDEQLIENHEALVEAQDIPGKAETTLTNNSIINHPNAIVTPHNAFNSTEALLRILDTTIENIKAFLAGSPQNIQSGS